MSATEQQGPGPLETSLFESLPGNYLLLSASLHILAASEDYLKLTGKRKADLGGKYLFDIFPETVQWAPNQNGKISESLQRVLAGGETDVMSVVRFDTPDDRGMLQERYWKTTNKPVNNTYGKIQYIIHHTVEVTAEVIKEKELQNTAEISRLQAEQMGRLFHDIPAQIAIVRGLDLVYEYINPQYQRELFPGREVMGLPLLVALPEIEGQPIWNILQQVYLTGKPYIENELLVPLAPQTGAKVVDHYFNTVYQPLLSRSGQVDGVLSFKYEVTEHVTVRKMLEISGIELGAANQKLSSSFSDLQAVHEELQSSNEEMAATNEELIRTQESLKKLNLELETRVADRTRQLEKSFEEQQALNEEINSANEELAAANEELVAINEELSETQQVLQKTLNGLKESEQRFRNLVRDATLGIILLTGTDLKVTVVNDVYGSLIGKTASELDNRFLFEVIPEAEAVFRPIIERVRNSGEPLYLYDQPYLVYKEDQSIEGFLNLVYQPYREADGTITGVMVLCQDVSEQVLARSKVEQSEGRFRLLLNAIPQQVWTATPDGTLDYVNQGVSSDFDQSPEAIVDKGWQEFVHPDDLPGAIRQWQRALHSGREYLTQFRLKFADGNYYWHLARALPLVEAGKVTLWLGTNTNIHQQKINEHQKDEFISIASHELKTPLTTIKAFFQLAKREAGEQKMLGQFVSKAERQLERLGRLIEDLLDVSKINAGKMVYNQEDFDFGQLLQDAVESTQQTIRHRIELQNECHVMYRGDQHRIEQVIINLLSNAAKYSPDADRILVNCTLEQQNLIVSVRDFGIGIAQDHLKGLFDRFYRVDNSSTRFQGLGLGLFIANEIVKRHGGSFWIESQPDEGSTFYFLLPLNGRQEFSDIATDQHTYYEGSFITIRYRPEGHYLDVDWFGYQNYESVVKGCGIMLDIMRKNNCSQVLNDNTHVKGNWSEASDWGAEVWFPDMAESGLKKFAWIYSPSTFSRIAANVSLPSAYDAVQVAFFDEKHAALAWLLHK